MENDSTDYFLSTLSAADNLRPDLLIWYLSRSENFNLGLELASGGYGCPEIVCKIVCYVHLGGQVSPAFLGFSKIVHLISTFKISKLESLFFFSFPLCWLL